MRSVVRVERMVRVWSDGRGMVRGRVERSSTGSSKVERPIAEV